MDEKWELEGKERGWYLGTVRTRALALGDGGGGYAVGAKKKGSHTSYAPVKKQSLKYPKQKKKQGSGKKGFDPSEARDPVGRWTAGGSNESGKTKGKGKHPSTIRQGDGLKGPPDLRTRAMQRILKSLGYDLGKGGVDGRFGPETARAVKKFQKNNKLPVTGIVDVKTGTLMAVRARQKAPGHDKPIPDHNRPLPGEKPAKRRTPAEQRAVRKKLHDKPIPDHRRPLPGEKPSKPKTVAEQRASLKKFNKPRRTATLAKRDDSDE